MTCKRGELQIPCAAALVMTEQAGRGLGKRHSEESRWIGPAMRSSERPQVSAAQTASRDLSYKTSRKCRSVAQRSPE